jgi:hypothetical protein
MCRTRRRSRDRTRKTHRTPKVTVGTVRKSTAIVPTRWLRTNVPQVCDGRPGRADGFGMYFVTVSLSTRCPSFANSPAMRRRPRAIRTMSATISAASGGRPIGFDFFAQNRAKPRRCHAITVAGFTIARASAQRDHVPESTTQNARSNGRRRGRGLVCRRIASCWRRARFSTTRLARGRKAASRAPTVAWSRASIAHNLAPRVAAVTGESHRPIRYPARPAMRAIRRERLSRHHRPSTGLVMGGRSTSFRLHGWRRRPTSGRAATPACQSPLWALVGHASSDETRSGNISGCAGDLSVRPLAGGCRRRMRRPLGTQRIFVARRRRVRVPDKRRRGRRRLDGRRARRRPDQYR